MPHFPVHDVAVDQLSQFLGGGAGQQVVSDLLSLKPSFVLRGNINPVILAERQVFGTVGIDMLAGPSEILIVADKNNNPNWIAIDLLSQAEHDPESPGTKPKSF